MSTHHAGWSGLILLSFVATARADPGDGATLKILARAFENMPLTPNIAGLPVRRGESLVIRSGEELLAYGPNPGRKKDVKAQQEATAELARALKMPGIDWKTQMVLAVSAGHRGTECTVAIAALTVHKGELAVVTKFTRGLVMEMSHPRCLVVCERFDGPVSFDDAITLAPVRTLACATWNSGYDKPTQIIAANEAEWADVWAKVTGDKSKPAPKVDWTKEVVLGVFQGRSRRIGVWTTILRVERAGKETTVLFREDVGRGTDEGYNSPFHIVAVPRSMGAIRFKKVE